MVQHHLFTDYVQRLEAPVEEETPQLKRGKQIKTPKFTSQRQFGQPVLPLKSKSPKIDYVQLMQTKCHFQVWHRVIEENPAGGLQKSENMTKILGLSKILDLLGAIASSWEKA